MSGATEVVLDEIVDEVLVGNSSLEEFAEKVIELVDELVNELLIDEITLNVLEENTDELVDEVAAGGTTLELKLLVDVGSVGDVEEIDVFVGDMIALELRLEVVVSINDETSLDLELRTEVVESEDGAISLELDSEDIEMNEELVMDTDTLELELLRRLEDVEVADVLNIG
jgi:hypothetical protein